MSHDMSFFFYRQLSYDQQRGCPATVPKGALRRIGTIVARRIDELM